MIYPKPKNEKEKNEYEQEAYEIEKNDLISIYKKMGYPEDELNQFLVNSLNGYEDQMKKDGLL